MDDFQKDEKLRRISDWLVDRLEYCDGHKRNNYSEDWEVYDRMAKGIFGNSYDENDKNESWRSQIYYNICEQKRRSALSQIDDALSLGGKFPFGLSETPEGESPAKVNEALRSIGVDTEKALKEMEKSIDDHLLESKSYKELRKSIDDCSKYGIGCFQAPFNYMDKARTIDLQILSSMPDLPNENGQLLPEGEAIRDQWLKEQVMPNMELSEIERIGFKRIRPADVFPDPSCEGDAQRGFGVFVRNHYDMATLRKMADEVISLDGQTKEPKYRKEAILNTLKRHHKSDTEMENEGRRQSDRQNRHNIEYDDSNYRGVPIYTFYGDITKLDVDGMMDGPTAQMDDVELASYDTQSVVVDFTREGDILRIIENPHPSGKRPIHLFQWEYVDGDWVGKGICEKLRDLQSEFNRFIQYWIDNKLLSSSVILGVITSKLDRSEDEDMSLYPGKTFFLREGESVNDMLQQFNVQDVSGAFLDGLNKLMELIDYESGVPRVIEGQTNSHAKTAFETQQMEAHALKQLGTVMRNIDEAMVAGIEMIYQWMLVYYDQTRIVIGDFKVHATGYSNFENKRIKMMEIDRLLELSMANPEFSIHFNVRKILEDKVSLLGVTPEKYMRLMDEVKEMQAQQAQQAQQQQQLEMQADIQAKLAVEQAKQQAKAMELQAKSQENELDREHEITRDLMELENR